MSVRLDLAARESALAAMAGQELDALVLGGGVVGAGTALDLVSRGLRVGLVERGDWASGGSSRSSKLIHGGLRYLGQLRFGLVREALQERTVLLDRLAPHLVRRVPFLYPLQTPAIERAYVGAGLLLYDALARIPGQPRALPPHRHLRRRSVARVAPGLRPEAVSGAVQFYDAQVDDARFVLTLVRTAAAYGARVAHQAEAVRLITAGDRVVGVRVQDRLTGAESEVRAKVVVAALGVWTPDLSGRLAPGLDAGVEVVASRGTHLVVPRDRIRSSTAVITRTPDAALLFMPWGRHWIIGPAETPWPADRDQEGLSAAEVDHLLAQANRHLITPLGVSDVVGGFAGLRPLVSRPSRRRPAGPLDPPEHAVRSPAPGLVVVAGGTLTTYRLLAAEAGDAAARSLGGLVEQSITHRLPLIGADGYHARWNQRHLLARQAGLPVARVEHLLNRYGSLADDLLEEIARRPELAAPLTGGEDYLAAEVVYGAGHEGAVHLADLLARRTRLAFEAPHHGLACAEEVARLAAGVLGWDDRRIAEEVGGYRSRLAGEPAPVRLAGEPVPVRRRPAGAAEPSAPTG